MTLTTPRLLLRPFRAGDQAAVHAYASDPEVVRFMHYGPNTDEQTAGFLAEALVRRPGRWLRAIERRSDGAVLGAVDLHVESEQHRRGEMGYVLARAAWGSGLLQDHFLVRGEFRDRLLFAKVAGQQW
jgi:RimJ/RimL family protein N-acetyltransferase